MFHYLRDNRTWRSERVAFWRFDWWNDLILKWQQNGQKWIYLFDGKNSPSWIWGARFVQWLNVEKRWDKTITSESSSPFLRLPNWFDHKRTQAKICFFKSFIWKAIIRNSWFKLHRMLQATIMYTNSRDDDSMGFLSIFYNAPKPIGAIAVYIENSK